MSTLITGGTGFIGAEIARMLVESDEDVHVAHRSGNLGRLEGIADRVQLHQFDLSVPGSAAALLSEVAPDRLFHFGAILTAPGEDDPQALLQANAVGFIETIEAARLAGTRQMIFASSIGTYGRDTGGGIINDLTLQRPGSVYGVTKVLGENLGAYYRQKYGLDFRGLRYPSIVGPGVTTWSVAQYTSWMIEKPALGEPFDVWVPPEAVVASISTSVSTQFGTNAATRDPWRSPSARKPVCALATRCCSSPRVNRSSSRPSPQPMIARRSASPASKFSA